MLLARSLTGTIQFNPMEWGGRAQRRPSFCFFLSPASAYTDGSSNPNRSTVFPPSPQGRGLG